MKRLLLLSCLFISSCTVMKPQECQNANWRDLGYSDALKGRTVMLNSRTQICSKANVIPDKKAYLDGYQLGAKKYCTYKNGFLTGRQGHNRTNVCMTPDLGKPFYEGYKDGLDVYQREVFLRERLRDMRERYDRRHHHPYKPKIKLK